MHRGLVTYPTDKGIMENTDILSTLREIKQSFRLLMNGVTAQSMREKGLDYHINWGANLLHLKEMAQEYKPDRQLAQALWHENVRECKIMATMLMPKTDFTYELAQLWIDQTKTQEIAEVATMNLYQHLDFAQELAMQLLAATEDIKQLHGFIILGRLFVKGNIMDERDINEFVDQATTALLGTNLSLKHSAINAIQHFANIDENYHLIAKNALKSIKMDDWL